MGALPRPIDVCTSHCHEIWDVYKVEAARNNEVLTQAAVSDFITLCITQLNAEYPMDLIVNAALGILVLHGEINLA